MYNLLQALTTEELGHMPSDFPHLFSAVGCRKLSFESMSPLRETILDQGGNATHC